MEVSIETGREIPQLANKICFIAFNVRHIFLILGKEPNFKKYTHVLEQKYHSPYDYGSIMHYSQKAFDKNGRDTIVPKQRGVTIGQRKGLSEVDIKELNTFYCGKDIIYAFLLFIQYQLTVNFML